MTLTKILRNSLLVLYPGNFWLYNNLETAPLLIFTITTRRIKTVRDLPRSTSFIFSISSQSFCFLPVPVRSIRCHFDGHLWFFATITNRKRLIKDHMNILVFFLRCRCNFYWFCYCFISTSVKFALNSLFPSGARLFTLVTAQQHLLNK